MFEVMQGDILSVEKVGMPILVVSKNFFNRSQQIMACPILKDTTPDPLHIAISTDEIRGIVLCEQVKLIDLCVRGYKKISEIKYEDIMNITDAIQSIFDYYPYGK